MAKKYQRLYLVRFNRDGLCKKYKSEHGALLNAIHRCHNPRNANYYAYGARGITVCDEWRQPDGLARLIEHIGPKPAKNLTLDRLDNSRGYEPGNVAWRTPKQQVRNRRPEFVRPPILFKGEWVNPNDLATQHGIERNVMRGRVNRGLKDDELIKPVRIYTRKGDTNGQS